MTVGGADAVDGGFAAGVDFRPVAADSNGRRDDF
jgi:hypothetical protein